MTLKDIANELVAGCREHRETANLDKLYVPDAASVEAVDQSGQGREVTGLDAIRGKHEWWENTMEVSKMEVSDPMLHGDDKFAVIFEVAGKDKTNDQTFEMKEVALYHVADGKITREEFFYAT
ncbi:MAG: nuclear transport factor 2 family protein [Pseudomonadota bacterium]